MTPQAVAFVLRTLPFQQRLLLLRVVRTSLDETFCSRMHRESQRKHRAWMLESFLRDGGMETEA